MKLLSDRAIPLRHSQIEITNADSVRDSLTDIKPDCVVNCAAYNWVDKAEDEPDAAHAGNAVGPQNLAMACEDRQIPLLHVSTDYVYGKEQRSVPYRETDSPGPVSVYGDSKLAGEQLVSQHCSRHFVVRTCGLYGTAETAGKGNFVKTMLRLGKERGLVRVVNDQHCTPTSTTHLARSLVGLIDTDAFGLYHATNSGATTWFDFAKEIFRAASLAVTTEPITTAEFNAKAPRPAYSVLDCQKVADATGKKLPAWQDAVAEYVKILIS